MNTNPDSKIETPLEADHRLARRQRVLKAGKIVLDGWRALDCTVRDVSDTGAKIKVGGTFGVPNIFKLLITSDNSMRPVKVVWKLDDTLGVVFTGPAEPAPARKFVTGMF